MQIRVGKEKDRATDKSAEKAVKKTTSPKSFPPPTLDPYPLTVGGPPLNMAKLKNKMRSVT